LWRKTNDSYILAKLHGFVDPGLLLLINALFFLAKLTTLAQVFRHVLAAISYLPTKNRNCCDLFFRKNMWCFRNIAEIALPAANFAGGTAANILVIHRCRKVCPEAPAPSP